MKKIFLSSAVAVLSCGFLAAETINFSDADFSKSLNTVAVTAAQNVKADISPAIKPAVARTGQYVQVSGYVNLNGNGWMPSNGGYTSVNLTGWGSFQDSTGKVTSNQAYITESASMWLYPNQYAYQTVYPNVYVQFYKDGKPVGSTYLRGSISVSGWPSSSFVSLSGSGYLSGSIYVEDAQ
ncbi:MAG TPA: hypothetical protein DCL44_10695 [Elusimicrobia bacterium]|nr:hypothetical protein [Elusimicrobiota bacterium]